MAYGGRNVAYGGMNEKYGGIRRDEVVYGGMWWHTEGETWHTVV